MNNFRIEETPGSRDGVTVLRLSGPFTLGAVFDFQSTVRNHRAPFTIVDLTGVPYMDSAALGSVLGFHVSCQRDSRHYALVGVSDRLRTMFKVAGVSDLLVMRDSIDHAESVLN